MKYLLTIIIALFAIGAMAQGRNEYEKKFVEVHLTAVVNCMVISDDSQKNRRDKLLYPNGEQIKSLAGLFGYMESLGFKQYTSAVTGSGFSGGNQVNTFFLFIHQSIKIRNHKPHNNIPFYTKQSKWKFIRKVNNLSLLKVSTNRFAVVL